MTGQRILIVEDESIVAMEIEHRLRGIGYEAAGRVDRGEDVLGAVADVRPDLVLMDIMLSGATDGIQAAEAIMAQFDIPVVYLTAYADDRTLERAKKTFPYGYLIKPFEEAELRTTIEIALYKHAMERKLRQSELRYRTLSEAAFEGVCVIDGTTIIDTNQQFCDMLGYEQQELVGRELFDIVAPESQAVVQERVANNEQGLYTPLALRKDGTRVPVEVRVKSMERDGKTIRIGTVRDMTSRLQAERSLKDALTRAEAEQKKTEAIIAAMGDGISIQDRDFRVLYQNQGHRNLVGDHLGELCYEAYEKQEGICEGCPVALSFADGKVHTVERSVTRDGQTIYAEITTSPIFDADGNIIAGIEIARNVTGRRQMEERLRKSEEQRRLVLENVHEIIYTISLDGSPLAGTVDFIGGNVEQVIGYRAEEFQQQPALWAKLIHPEDLPGVRTSTEQIIGQQRPGVRIYRLRPKGRTEYRWFEDKVVPRVEDGRVTGYFGVARDITEQRLTDEVVRQQFETQTVVNELLQFSLADLNLSEVLQRTLERILSITWLSFESRGCIFLAEGQDLVIKAQMNMTVKELTTCSRLPFGSCLCGRAAATKEAVFANGIDERHDIIHEGVGSHGHYCVPILHGENLLGVINIYLNEGYERSETDLRFLQAVSRTLALIIHRKNMEQEQARLHQELQDLFGLVAHAQKEWQITFDSITDMIAIHDEDQTITRVNRAFARSFGLEPRDVIGKKCSDIINPGSGPATGCPHRSSLEQNRPVSEEITDLQTGRVMLISTFPYLFPGTDKRGVIHVMRDITAERENEMRLIVTERLASLGQMASGIAHEINNPLAAIAGCSEGLLNRVKQRRFDEEFFTNYLGIIQEEIMRCKKITSSMLSMVRKTSYDWKEVDLHEILNRTVEIIGYQGRLKAVEVVRRFDDAIPPVFVSEGEIRQVFLAIITNALDAMEDRGVLTVATQSASPMVVVRITDQGPGIAQDQMYKIFEPFYTTKADRGGTGLGLSIARKIITNHHGALDLSSEPDSGTTVTITLPMRPPVNG